MKAQLAAVGLVVVKEGERSYSSEEGQEKVVVEGEIQAMLMEAEQNLVMQLEEEQSLVMLMEEEQILATPMEEEMLDFSFVSVSLLLLPDREIRDDMVG